MPGGMDDEEGGLGGLGTIHPNFADIRRRLFNKYLRCFTYAIRYWFLYSQI